MSRETASQTAGPYLHIGLLPNAAGLPMYDGDLGQGIGAEARDDLITLTGRILDGEGAGMPDAMIELWQADADGSGVWQRSGCDGDGRYTFQTPRPGTLPGQAPHLTLWLVARGIGLALQTRAYFQGKPENAADPVLARVPDGRRETLMATPEGGVWHMNVVLQGSDETVFLDI
jgi:protocatechuate 3,4-dioxygenase alpha subunit